MLKTVLYFPLTLLTDKPGNTKGGSITVPLASCWTGLESAISRNQQESVTTDNFCFFICKTD
jgi:hypothetical protein